MVGPSNRESPIVLAKNNKQFFLKHWNQFSSKGAQD